jgi:hypothetical protein
VNDDLAQSKPALNALLSGEKISTVPVLVLAHQVDAPDVATQSEEEIAQQFGIGAQDHDNNAFVAILIGYVILTNPSVRQQGTRPVGLFAYSITSNTGC